MTIEELQSRLRAARSTIGYGRFALTLSMDGREEAYITHWFAPAPGAFEDCRAIGSGTVNECLDSLNRYVAGIASVRAPSYSIAAE